MMSWFVRIAVPLVVGLFLVVSGAAAGAPHQPGQPATGPGGSSVQFPAYVMHHYGPDPKTAPQPTGFWIFEPVASKETATLVGGTLPLVIFFHGFGAIEPGIYQDWIAHIVQRGAIVVEPDWQNTIPPASYLTQPTSVSVAKDLNTSEVALQAAMHELATGKHDAPNLSRVALIGHSDGAVIAARYAAVSASQELPVPRAILLANPACNGCDFGSLTTIPADTRVIILTGNADKIAGEDPSRIFAAMTSVPGAQRDLITMMSDNHGEPALVANHNVVTVGSLQHPDAFNWYGVWKWTDALMSCAFAQQGCAVALGNTPQQRFMGTWSDGVPIAQPHVVVGGSSD